MRKIVIALAILFALGVALGVSGCQSKADVVSHNISTEADQFKIERQIVFFNGITDKYLLVIQGRCSLGNNDPVKELSVTCEVAPGQYEKHFLGLSDNVSYFSQQVTPAAVSDYHYTVLFRPETVVPNFEHN